MFSQFCTLSWQSVAVTRSTIGVVKRIFDHITFCEHIYWVWLFLQGSITVTKSLNIRVVSVARCSFYDLKNYYEIKKWTNSYNEDTDIETLYNSSRTLQNLSISVIRFAEAFIIISVFYVSDRWSRNRCTLSAQCAKLRKHPFLYCTCWVGAR